MVAFALSWCLSLAQAPLPQDTTLPSPWVDPGFHKLIAVWSPNLNDRPTNGVVDTVVLHSTVIPTLERTVAGFARVSSQVSSHFVIGKDGSIVECVPTFERAWHAGVSQDRAGRQNVNNFSIGIELVNLNDGSDPYPERQVEALRYLLIALKRRFPLKSIESHEFVALPHGRKSDPRGFPWKALEGLRLELDH